MLIKLANIFLVRIHHDWKEDVRKDEDKHESASNEKDCCHEHWNSDWLFNKSEVPGVGEAHLNDVNEWGGNSWELRDLASESEVCKGQESVNDDEKDDQEVKQVGLDWFDDIQHSSHVFRFLKVFEQFQKRTKDRKTYKHFVIVQFITNCFKVVNKFWNLIKSSLISNIIVIGTKIWPHRINVWML